MASSFSRDARCLGKNTAQRVKKALKSQNHKSNRRNARQAIRKNEEPVYVRLSGWDIV